MTFEITPPFITLSGNLEHTKENKNEKCAQSKGRLLQLLIQALQVTECGYLQKQYSQT